MVWAKYSLLRTLWIGVYMYMICTIKLQLCGAFGIARQSGSASAVWEASFSTRL